MKPTPKKRRAHVATEAEAATLNFEPWRGEIDFELLPNNEQFTEDGLGHLRICRFAVVTMYKTKAELAEMLGQMEDEEGYALMNGFIAAKDFFSRFVEFLDLAEARIIVAGSAYSKAADVADRSLRKILRSHGRAAPRL
jgi:hypothetical protein